MRMTAAALAVRRVALSTDAHRVRSREDEILIDQELWSKLASVIVVQGEMYESWCGADRATKTGARALETRWIFWG